MIRKQKMKDGSKVKVTFILPEDHPYGDIGVVGDFNNWDPDANRFIRRSNKTYSTSATVDTGQRYAFRYFCEDGSWVNEAEADDYEPNAYGSQNCILIT